MKINNNHTEAQVISTYSRRMKIRTNDTKIGFAKILGKQLKPVCGDIVIIKKEENEPESIITDILPRKNSLSRKNKYKNKEVLASNLSDIAIVVSNPPSPDWHIVDRYIGAAENMGINAFIICNKDDLQWVEKENTILKRKDRKPKESGKWTIIYAIKKRLKKKQDKNIVRKKEMNFMKKKLTICMVNLIFNIRRL